MSEQRDRWGGEGRVPREDAVEQRANQEALSEQRDRWGGEGRVPREDAVEQRANHDALSEREHHEPVRHADAETVEEMVRGQLAKALGGRRGMIEAAVPTLAFTLLWVTTRDLRTALVVSVAAAVVLLAVRLVQRSTVQFVLNALFGIGLGWLFVTLSARGGATEDEQALAYFLPGLLYNTGYAVLLAFTCLIGWPLVGFMVGSVTGDPTAWHDDKQVVRLCTRLTWLLVLPCIVRVAVQAPVWFGGRSGAIDADAAVAVLGVLKIALGWPLQVAALAAMVWLLARNHTPVTSSGS